MKIIRKNRLKIDDVVHEIDDNIDITEEIAKTLVDATGQYDINTDEARATISSARFKKIFSAFARKNKDK
jgi:hypothetical protein